MNLLALFGACVFGHARDPLIVMHGKVMTHECRRCQMNLGPVLAGQLLKVKKIKKAKRQKLKLVADVVPIERERQSQR